MSASPGPTMDCLIIGGGPAGLTAAIYLARFHLQVGVVDDGNSRALLIPKSHNLPDFPGGISGAGFLSRQREHALRYGAAIGQGRVENLALTPAGFVVRTSEDSWTARSVLLATGVTNRRPPIDDDIHAEALRRGHRRYCPVCDGYEVTGKNVAVIGDDEKAVAECEFLRSFTDSLTMISMGAYLPDCCAEGSRRLVRLSEPDRSAISVCARLALRSKPPTVLLFTTPSIPPWAHPFTPAWRANSAQLRPKMDASRLIGISVPP
jgi:thioredoxin reductase